MQFVIYRDNGARYHWRLMDENGIRLAVSPASFSSADDARQAAADLRDGTVSTAVIEG